MPVLERPRWLHRRPIVNDWSVVALETNGTLRVERKSLAHRLPATAARDYRIALDEGALCAEIAHRDAVTQGPLVIETPQVQIFVIGTSFCVHVRNGISSVSVTQGRVEGRRPSGTAFVSAGESHGPPTIRA